ncbi:MAG: MerR family transcriptional regulator [Deltaproteobacteria bacterium]|nr:MerR family transcriptional regulator [Deltaproteobacteria bacterium]
MDDNLPDKAFFRIGEVGKILQVKPYVIRFWETEFKILKPVRTPSGHRLYRKKDVDALLLIRKLLYERRYTIQGAKQHLAEVARQKTDRGADTNHERLVEIKKVLIGILDLIDGRNQTRQNG